MTTTRRAKRKPQTRRLTNQQIADAVSAHRWIGRYSLRYPTGYYASQNLAALERAAKEIGERQEALMRVFADREEEGGPPKRGKKGQGYEITEREYEYRQAEADLLADTTPVRVIQLKTSDLDFLLPAPPRRGEEEEEVERQNFLDVIPPLVWAQLGPLLAENEEEPEESSTDEDEE